LKTLNCLFRSPDRAALADLIFMLTGPRSYQSFVLEAGWPPRDWVRWVTATLRHDLFGD
jgi:hypothetical protein